MPSSTPQFRLPALKALLSHPHLNDADTGLFDRMASNGASIRAGAQVVAQGAPCAAAMFIVSGWAANVRMLAGNRRQVISFLLPGDGIGTYPRPTRIGASSVVALTELVVLDAEEMMIAARAGRAPGVLKAVAAAQLLETHLLMDHVVRLGRQSGLARMAHLLLEIQERLSLVGLVQNHEFALPVTQQTLGDALGLSAVHINRLIQQLRAGGLADIRANVVRLLRPDALAKLAEYAAPPLEDAVLLAQHSFAASA